MSDAIQPFNPENIPQAMQLAETLAKSTLIPTPLRGKPGDVLVVLMRGRELGLSPLQALSGIHVIEGKAVVSSDLIVGLCARRPEVCEYFRLAESTDRRAVYETRRRGAAPVKMEWTIQQAAQANLLGKNNWKLYPAAMLRARCSAALARAVYPDLVLGVYAEDEADDIRASAVPTPAGPPLGLVAPPETVDAVTGEVAATKPEPEDADWTPSEPAAMSEVDIVTVAVREAQSIADLQGLVARIKTLPKAAQEAVRGPYNRRRAELAKEVA